MKLRYGFYLTVGKIDDGRTMAICSDGTPQLGHRQVTVLSVEAVESQQEANEWFARMKIERPWETRQ